MTNSVTVSLYENGPHDYQIGAEIEVRVDNLSKEKTQEMLEMAHQVCPYSKATQGNIDVTLKTADGAANSARAAATGCPCTHGSQTSSFSSSSSA